MLIQRDFLRASRYSAPFAGVLRDSASFSMHSYFSSHP
jgi:hypothetical protein